MKRYEHYCSWDGGGPADPEEESCGGWVRHEDASAEIARLTGALKRANDQAEHFEREWYLAKDDAERYRWLRNGCDEKNSAASSIATNCYGMEWDAAIDAAMTA